MGQKIEKPSCVILVRSPIKEKVILTFNLIYFSSFFRDIFISGPEWCGCFSKAERPCAAVRKRLVPDSAPACDSRGYYKSTQCHRGLGLCWCVDPHGVEFAGTRTRGSKPDCGNYRQLNTKVKNIIF